MKVRHKFYVKFVCERLLPMVNYGQIVRNSILYYEKDRLMIFLVTIVYIYISNIISFMYFYL